MARSERPPQTYTSPQLLSLGKAIELTRGSGDIYPDSLGTAGTHYGKAGITKARAAK